jgi:hypothetical protein
MEVSKLDCSIEMNSGFLDNDIDIYLEWTYYDDDSLPSWDFRDGKVSRTKRPEHICQD